MLQKSGDLGLYHAGSGYRFSGTPVPPAHQPQQWQGAGRRQNLFSKAREKSLIA